MEGHQAEVHGASRGGGVVVGGGAIQHTRKDNTVIEHIGVPGDGFCTLRCILELRNTKASVTTNRTLRRALIAKA